MFNVLYSKLIRGLVMFALLLTFVLFAFQSSAEACGRGRLRKGARAAGGFVWKHIPHPFRR